MAVAGRRLAAAAGALLALLAGGAAAQPVTVDAAIVLAVDASGSIDREERALQRQGYAAALRHPDLMRAIAAGRHGRIALSYFEWAGQARAGTLIAWRLIDDAVAAAAFADEVARLAQPAARGTSISRALDFGVALFDERAFAPAKRIIDISGDGPNNVGPPVTLARDRAVARGITVNGLPVLVRPSRGMTGLDRYFEDCVIGGEGAFVLAVRSRAELALAVRRKLILEISGAGPERLRAASQPTPTDCLIGERVRRGGFGNF